MALMLVQLGVPLPGGDGHSDGLALLTSWSLLSDFACSFGACDMLPCLFVVDGPHLV